MIESSGLRISIKHEPTIVYRGEPCPEYYTHFVVRGRCERLWGVEKLLKYTLTRQGKPAVGVITERLMDLGHNHPGREGCSLFIQPQHLDANGSFSDHLLWGLHDVPPPKSFYKKCGQVLYKDGQPFLVNIIEFRMAAERGAEQSQIIVKPLPISSSIAVTITNHLRNKE